MLAVGVGGLGVVGERAAAVDLVVLGAVGGVLGDAGVGLLIGRFTVGGRGKGGQRQVVSHN